MTGDVNESEVVVSEIDVAQHVEMINGLIDSGAAWSTLLEYFPSREAMFGFVANRLAARHPGDQPKRGACCECGGEGHQQLARFTWEYCTNEASASPKALLSLAVGHLPLPGVVRHRVNTHHLFCEACWAKRSGRWRRGTVLQVPGTLLMAGGLMLSIVWAIAYPIMRLNPSSDTSDMEQLGWMGVPALLVGLPLSIWSRRLRVPPSLRYIARRPFQLIRLSIVN